MLCIYAERKIVDRFLCKTGLAALLCVSPHQFRQQIKIAIMTTMQPIKKNVLARCSFKAAFFVLTLLTAMFCARISVAAEPGNTPSNLVYVGTNDNQISALRFNADTGKLASIGPVADVSKPRWAVAHPTLPILYSVNDDSTKHGSIIAFAVNRETGKLTKINEVTAVGSGGTYLWLDAASMTLLVANYGDGSTSSISINHDGSLGALVSTIKAAGSGPNKRQAGPHNHAVAVDPSGRYALVSDLGADRVFVYGFDRATHALSPDDAANPRSFIAPAGSGPRHFVFGLNGRFVYLLSELNADITTLRWDAQHDALTPIQSLSTSSPGFQGVKSGSEIAISADGRFVYAGNRSENALVVYRVNPESGELSFVQRTSSGGVAPWAFTIHPSGKWMLVANSEKVSVFRINAASGMLADTGQSLDAPTPLSITVVK